MGGQDPIAPAAHLSAMRAGLEQGSPAARSSRIDVYPHAGHAFLPTIGRATSPPTLRMHGVSA
ncbi:MULTISPECIES: dienelactone hydrolase family protein [Mycetohabitans]|uniref:dienelactone hydrolase family protein n=1 Tax=Mycetohabitans TaxID=2571159 RepID=UPI001E3F0050|nr:MULTISPECIES: dienelactone hydrolase family protein [Mycetohabitans]